MPKLEPVLRLLTFLVVFFTLDLFIAVKFFPQNATLFQAFYGLLTGFGGAMLLRVKPQSKEEEAAGLASTTATVATTTTTATTPKIPSPTEEPQSQPS